MDKKIMGILFLVVLVSFSGIAAASTIGDTGSTIIYTSTSDKANNWYISTLTDQFFFYIHIQIRTTKIHI